MKTMPLWIVGDSCRDVEIEVGVTTLKDLAEQQGLTGYDFQVGGVPVARTDWAAHIVDPSSDVWASQGVKGA